MVVALSSVRGWDLTTLRLLVLAQLLLQGEKHVSGQWCEKPPKNDAIRVVTGRDTKVSTGLLTVLLVTVDLKVTLLPTLTACVSTPGSRKQPLNRRQTSAYTSRTVVVARFRTFYATMTGMVVLTHALTVGTNLVMNFLKTDTGRETP